MVEERKGKERKAFPIRAVYVRCFLLYGLGSRVFLLRAFTPVLFVLNLLFHTV